MKKQFGELLKECRKDAGFTQIQLGEKLQLHGSMISRFEQGKSVPNLEQVQAIVNILDREGVPKSKLNRLRQAVDNTQHQLDTPVAHPVVWIINQVFEKLSPVERGLLSEDLERLIEIDRDYFRAQKENDEQRWQSAGDHLESLHRLLETFIQHLRLRVYKAWGQSSYSQGYLNEAVDHYQVALQSAHGLGGTQSAELGTTHIKLGDASRRLAEWELAEKHYQRARGIFKNLNDELRYAWSLRKLAGLRLFQGRPGEAWDLCEKSLSICKRIGNDEGVYKALQHKGWANIMLGRWDEAVQLYEQALDQVEEEGREWELLKAYRYLGNAYLQTQADKAREAFEKAEDIMKQLEEKKVQSKLESGMVWLGLGQTHLKEGRTLEAKRYLDRSLDIHLKLGEDFMGALVENELGNLLDQLGEHQQAEWRLVRAKIFLEKFGNYFFYTEALVNLCKFYHNRRNFRKVHETAGKAKEAVEKVERGLIDIHLARIQTVLGKTYVAEEQYSKATEAFCTACEKAAGYNKHLMREILRDIQAEIDRLQRAGKHEIAITICEALEQFWSNKEKEEQPFVQEPRRVIRRQREEIAVLAPA